MYLIINEKTKMIYSIANMAKRINDHNVCVNDSLTLASGDKLLVISMDNIPEYVEPEKYCYNETDGFYENPNYTEPEEPVTLEDLEKEIMELRANLDYLTMITDVDLMEE